MRLRRRYWLWCLGIIETLALAVLLAGVVVDGGGYPGDALVVIEWVELLAAVGVTLAALSYPVWAVRRAGNRFARVHRN